LKAVLAVLATIGGLSAAHAAEIVDREGGYRLEVPRGWEGRVKGERIELVDPSGESSKGGLPKGTSRMWVRPIADPNFWFEQLLHRDETRDVRRVPAREGADGRFDYVDGLARGGVDQQVSIVCRQISTRWVCVTLEYRLDDPASGAHRALQMQVLDSLRPTN